MPASVEGAALAGLVTHGHRDHADAGALRRVLAPGAPVLGPPDFGGDALEILALAQSRAELGAAGLEVEALDPWATTDLGPFRIVALPAVDGLGDPQVSWLVEAEGRRLLHLGDTMFHGYWWRIAQRVGPVDVAFVPVNGARIDFPHRQPPSGLPAVMDPEQAAAAVAALGARSAVPMHDDGYGLEPYYRPLEHAAARFADAASGGPAAVRVLAVGDELDVAEAVGGAGAAR